LAVETSGGKEAQTQGRTEMNQHTAAAILERLDGIESHLCKLTKIVNLLTKNTRIVKEIQNTMATQADVDAISATLDAVKTEINKIGADLAAFIDANPNISVADLSAKASEVAAALQSIDDVLPERP